MQLTWKTGSLEDHNFKSYQKQAGSYLRVGQNQCVCNVALEKSDSDVVFGFVFLLHGGALVVPRVAVFQGNPPLLGDISKALQTGKGFFCVAALQIEFDEPSQTQGRVEGGLMIITNICGRVVDLHLKDLFDWQTLRDKEMTGCS